jgi:hypothetical protein
VPTPAPTPVRATEYFSQNSAAKVDILVVNDNSYSMANQQRRMADRFSAFTGNLNGIDYQMGMTTTDLVTRKYRQDGKLMKWEHSGSKILTPQTHNAEKVFKDTIARDETFDCDLLANKCPSGYEQPMKASIWAMEQRFTANKGFFRDGVDLAIVILSNEDELSNGTVTKLPDGKTYAPTTANQVLSSFQAAFGNTKRLAVHGIIIKPGDQKCLVDQRAQSSFANNAFYGVMINDLITKTGGQAFSICDEDYSGSLKAISDSVRQLVTSFDLLATPKPGTVQVVLTPAANIGWKVVGNKVIFDSPPPVGTRIEVSYER